MTRADLGNNRGPRGGVYRPSQGRGRGILTGMGGQTHPPAFPPQRAAPGWRRIGGDWRGRGPPGSGDCAAGG